MRGQPRPWGQLAAEQSPPLTQSPLSARHPGCLPAPRTVRTQQSPMTQAPGDDALSRAGRWGGGVTRPAVASCRPLHPSVSRLFEQHKGRHGQDHHGHPGVLPDQGAAHGVWVSVQASGLCPLCPGHQQSASSLSCMTGRQEAGKAHESNSLLRRVYGRFYVSSVTIPSHTT